MSTDINIKRVQNIDPIKIEEVDKIAPVTIAAIEKVEKIAPVAVHIKELNQVDPLSIESLRVDRVREIDPLNVDRLNVTRLPVVNLSVNQVPQVALDVRRIPPVAIAVHQSFELPSEYAVRARLLGFEVLRLAIAGTTRIIPRECARREVGHSHERSFPCVAALGNPAIPSSLEERCTEVIAPALRCGPPRFAYGAGGPRPRARWGG